MASDENEQKLLRSVALQNSQAVLLARERAERELISAKDDLERKSSELAGQREFFRVTLASIGDAVIAADTESRITYLNSVAEAMTGWKSSEALGQPVESVFHIVDESSRKPARNPVSEVLRESTVVKLADYAILIARDGREIAIDDSAAPIRDATGKVCGVVMVFHDVTKQRRTEKDLRESNQLLSEARDHLEKRVLERTTELKAANDELRELSVRLLKTQDDERRRLARELHDSVGQLLAALSMNIALVQSQSQKLDEAAQRAVVENAQLVQQVSKEIRTISHLLHPPLLELAGLASAVRWYVDGFSERSKIKVDVEVVPSDLGQLPEEVELAVFRIVQECLTNVHRHSGSASATIRLQRGDGRLVVQIQDRGEGIPKEKLGPAGTLRTGVGFSGIRERLRHLGGELEIQSDAEGTLVSATLAVG